MGVPGDPGCGNPVLPAASAVTRLRRSAAGERDRGQRGEDEGEGAPAGHHLLSRMTAQTLTGRIPSGLHSWIAVQTALQSKSFTVQVRRAPVTVQEA